ncbi:hypothetical protein [Flavihumibacter fluvii]|uniref:hypothetical protein n=1 Tax=Flavihumibacter fluvii TaxID=2838157 RepID=UPI001EFA9FA6|nr:hypothetical protein [Flavihumibacter fluvii]ULQ52176.1 hypothetical protein KJS93_18965 [Flavihumibacter fluvii]
MQTAKEPLQPKSQTDSDQDQLPTETKNLLAQMQQQQDQLSQEQKALQAHQHQQWMQELNQEYRGVVDYRSLR